MNFQIDSTRLYAYLRAHQRDTPENEFYKEVLRAIRAGEEWQGEEAEHDVTDQVSVESQVVTLPNPFIWVTFRFYRDRHSYNAEALLCPRTYEDNNEAILQRLVTEFGDDYLKFKSDNSGVILLNGKPSILIDGSLSDKFIKLRMGGDGTVQRRFDNRMLFNKEIEYFQTQVGKYIRAMINSEEQSQRLMKSLDNLVFPIANFYHPSK